MFGIQFRCGEEYNRFYGPYYNIEDCLKVVPRVLRFSLEVIDVSQSDEFNGNFLISPGMFRCDFEEKDLIDVAYTDKEKDFIRHAYVSEEMLIKILRRERIYYPTDFSKLKIIEFEVFK